MTITVFEITVDLSRPHWSVADETAEWLQRWTPDVEWLPPKLDATVGAAPTFSGIANAPGWLVARPDASPAHEYFATASGPSFEASDSHGPLRVIRPVAVRCLPDPHDDEVLDFDPDLVSAHVFRAWPLSDRVFCGSFVDDDDEYDYDPEDFVNADFIDWYRNSELAGLHLTHVWRS